MQMSKIEIGHLFPNLNEHLGHFLLLRLVLVGEHSCRPLECDRKLAHGRKEGVQVFEIFLKRRKLRKVLDHFPPLIRVLCLAKISDIRKASGWWNAGIFGAPIVIKFKKTKDPRLVQLHGFSHIELVMALRQIPFHGTKLRNDSCVKVNLVGELVAVVGELVVVVGDLLHKIGLYLCLRCIIAGSLWCN
jgi:hypothetical protein